MQVLQWLFKVLQDQKPAKDDDQRREDNSSEKEEERSKEVVCQNQKMVARKARKPEETRLDCRNFRYLALLIRSRGKSRAYFYSTLNQKTLKSLNHRQQQYYIRSVKMNKEDLVGSNNKVLPIGESTSSALIASTGGDPKQCGPSSEQKKGRGRGEQSNKKGKNLSRMKELLRWDAASKSGKGGRFGRKGLYLRSRSAATKAGGFDEELRNDCSNMSNRCSDYDQYCTHKTGHWITTDDEFVVLEL